MQLPYYEGKKLSHVEIKQCCPGCGRIDQLSMRSKVNSYMHNIVEFFIGCNCGWLGPTAANQLMAAVKWEARSMINLRQESIDVTFRR